MGDRPLFQGSVGEQKDFAWRDGDEVLVCIESAEVVESKTSGQPYSNTTLRVIVGPLGDRSRSAGPVVQGDGQLYSKVMFDNVSFSEKAVRRVNAVLFACGHEGGIVIANDRDWLRAVLDHEVKVRIRLEEYEGKTRPRPASYLRPTHDEMRKIAAVYEEFGCARGYGWTDQKEEPLIPWDPTKYEIPQAGTTVAGAPVAGRRAALRQPPPTVARDEVAGSQGRSPEPTNQGRAPEPESQVEQEATPATLRKQLEGMTVDQVKVWLANGADGLVLAQVEQAEREGKARKKVLALIAERMAAEIIAGPAAENASATAAKNDEGMPEGY